ncbi:hypothetical protein C8J57DRAFT_1531790 [Mycena rebaudengoi]|nr:hypothetical protein C8J57DRAFT_1539217 [Mycena rebaudengoi]KAJ7234248.1 hypothetical protein C8J57DRAFT_1531790 [Mycena rebaudengoi]
MSRIPLFGGYYLGTGLISVVGTSFGTLSTANAVFDAMYRDGTLIHDACPDAYGKVLGSNLSNLLISEIFLPARVLKHVFPPMVTDTFPQHTSRQNKINHCHANPPSNSSSSSSAFPHERLGAPNWGGGSNCRQTRPPLESGSIIALCPTILAQRPLPWASPEFIGLGFLSSSASY